MPETLEREQELDRISEALDRASRGEGGALLLEGPPGIGKTRLVQDARALAKLRGFGRLQATGDELERAMTWGAVRQLVERSISRYDGEIRAALLAGPSGRALAALGEAAVELATGDAADARTLHALWWVAVDLSASRPLLITVDDAQWADTPSLRFLAYLSRRIADLPVTLIVATRPVTDRSGPLVDLGSGRDVEILRLRPLSVEGVAQLGARLGTSPAPAVSEALHAASGGNPFLAGLLLDELDARGRPVTAASTASEIAMLGPSRVSRALLARLPEEAITLATGAAVLGARSDPSVAAAVAGLPDALIAAAMDALEHGNVTERGASELRFVHPVVREAVLAQLAAGQRAALHAVAARVLDAAGASDARIAAHLVRAPQGTLPDAASVLQRSARAALAEGDVATATGQLERAAAEAPGDTDLLAELGVALLRRGDAGAARQALLRAAEGADGQEARARRLASAASALFLIEGPSAAISELRATLARWPVPAAKGEADPSRLVLEARLALVAALVPDADAELSDRLQRFATLPGATADERFLLARLAQRARYDVLPASHTIEIATRALSDGALFDDAVDMDGLIGWVISTVALASADGIDAAHREIEHVGARLRRGGSAVEFAMMSIPAAWVAWRTGELSAAEAHCDAALDVLDRVPPGPQIDAVITTLVHCGTLVALERGDLAAADALIAAGAGAETDTALVVRPALGEARSLLALARGDAPRALREALTLGEALVASRTDTPTLAWRSAAALAALRTGDDAWAARLAEEQVVRAERWEAATDLGAALRVRARVRPEHRLADLEASLAVLEPSSRPARAGPHPL